MDDYLSHLFILSNWKSIIQRMASTVLSRHRLTDWIGDKTIFTRKFHTDSFLRFSLGQMIGVNKMSLWNMIFFMINGLFMMIWPNENNMPMTFVSKWPKIAVLINNLAHKNVVLISSFGRCHQHEGSIGMRMGALDFCFIPAQCG